MVMVPAEELPPGTPFTVQLTDVLVAPVTVAVNCSVLPTLKLAETGEIETETVLGADGVAGAGAEGEVAEPPPQPTLEKETTIKTSPQSDERRKIPLFGEGRGLVC